MPALTRVSGPNHCFVQFPGGQPLYLGTPERSLEVEWKPYYEPVMNQLAGTQLPFDETFQGLAAELSGVFTRYDATVMNLIMTAPPLAAPPALGSENRLSRGSLTYGRYFPSFIVVNGFFGTANAAPDDLPGYRFLNAKFAALKIGEQGTTATKYGVAVSAIPVYVPSTGGFVCYTVDAAIPALLSQVN